jgi:hypothetical protein
MTHHQRVNGDVDFSALDIPSFLLRDREVRGTPAPTLAKRADAGRLAKVDPMELSKVMATDHTVPKLLQFGLINSVRKLLIWGCVVGIIAVGYHYIAHLWPH